MTIFAVRKLYAMITTSGKINILKTTEPQVQKVDFDNLPFGKLFSDHMFVMDYENGEWQQPVIQPFQSMNLHPACSALHYGQSIFEGLKAFKNKDEDPVIFRPDMNAKRFNKSAERMCMPTIPEELFLNALKELINLDADWIPPIENSALYIRPFMFATDEYVGIRPSEKYKFIIFTCPVGAYYAEPLKVKIETHYTRASEGGVGRAKTAGNYGASLYPAKKGQEQGYHQLVWTDGKTHEFIEESGTMNIMFMIGNTLVTPSEESDTILKGITKRSVVEIAKDWGMKVEERKVTVKEIIAAAEEGTLKEVFGAGTAATIAPIKTIHYDGKDYELPAVEQREFSNKVFKYLKDIKLGLVPDPHGWVYKV